MTDFFVCSKSTKKYIKGENYYLVTAPPTKDILKKAQKFSNVIAIGGGAVIDTAKILSKTPITCYPTTASGASDTSHSVYWDGSNKKNFNSFLPKQVFLKKEYVETLPSQLVLETKSDLIAHCLDVIWSKDKTEDSEFFAKKGLSIISKNPTNLALIKAGRFGGKAIEITPTTILHSLSYPLTGIYNISHGLALSYLIPKVSSLMNFDPPNISYTKNLSGIDWDIVVRKAMQYPKFHNTNKKLSFKNLTSVLS